MLSIHRLFRFQKKTIFWGKNCWIAFICVTDYDCISFFPTELMEEMKIKILLQTKNYCSTCTCMCYVTEKKRLYCGKKDKRKMEIYWWCYLRFLLLFLWFRWFWWFRRWSPRRRCWNSWRWCRFPRSRWRWLVYNFHSLCLVIMCCCFDFPVFLFPQCLCLYISENLSWFRWLLNHVISCHLTPNISSWWSRRGSGNHVLFW